MFLLGDIQMNVVRSFECMNACILNHLNRAKMEINGSDIFFSGQGYPISYKKGSLTRIKSDGYNANFRFLQRYGIDYQFGRVRPEKDVLLKYLQEPYTITIRMVSDCLVYDKVFSQTPGASHFVNIMDYNEQKKMFLIMDGDVPSMETGCFLGWVDEKDILKGWQVMRGELLQMKLSYELSQPSLVRQVKKVANEHMRHAINLYLKGKQSLFSGQVSGEKAICYMIQQIGKYVGKSIFKELVQEANFRIRVDGYLGGKLFLLEKLEEQQRIDVAKEYEEVVKGWSRWCMLLLKAGLIPSEKNIRLIKNKMEELLERERICLKKVL